MEVRARKIFMWVIVTIALVVIFLGVLTSQYKDTSENNIDRVSPSVSTRSDAPENIIVPGVDSVDVPENFAKPVAVAPSLSGAVTDIRIYNIDMDENSFMPDTIVVEKGDTVRISIHSLDGDYDVIQPDYGFRQTIDRGETKAIEFQATAEGKFTFFCNSCGGPSNGPVGSIVVVPQK